MQDHVQRKGGAFLKKYKIFQKFSKKVLTKENVCDILYNAVGKKDCDLKYEGVAQLVRVSA